MTGALRDILHRCPELATELTALDPVSAASTFAGLTLMPTLQANCLRLEALVHLSIALGRGSSIPQKGTVQTAFVLSHALVGDLEQAVEDVFVSLVNTSTGNYMLLEGLIHGAAFNVQRIVDTLQSSISDVDTGCLLESVTSLLKLSNAAARRAGLSEYLLGEEHIQDRISPELIESAESIAELVAFSRADLEVLGISDASVRRFEFDLAEAPLLLEAGMLNSRLEHKPIARSGDVLYLLLPSTIGSSIVHAAVEVFEGVGGLSVLENALGHEFGRLFRRSALLGNLQLAFHQAPGGLVGVMCKEVDPGRHLILLFVVSGLIGFVEPGRTMDRGIPLDPLFTLVSQISEDPEFTRGIVLLIHCGLGQELVQEHAQMPPGWELEALSAYDMYLLCWLRDVNKLSLFKMDQSKRLLGEQHTKIVNAFGYLNLVAWARKLHGHLVPHSSLPREFANSERNVVEIHPAATAIRDLRQQVLRDIDLRRVMDTSGYWCLVRKRPRGFFEEDNHLPVYFSVDDVVEGRFRSVYVGRMRSYWLSVEFASPVHPERADDHWKMLELWLSRSARAIDEALSLATTGPVQFTVRSANANVVGETMDLPTIKEESELRTLLQTVRTGQATVQVDILEGYCDGYLRPDNVAERLIAEALITGAGLLCSEPLRDSEIEELVARICPNTEARHAHRFLAQSFRDYVSAKTPRTPILIDELDTGICRVGLAWSVLSRGSTMGLVGVENCTSFLGDLVKSTMDRICLLLRRWDRRELVSRTLMNHEAIERDRSVWRRTASANFGLHSRYQETLAVILDRDNRLNAGAIASRLLLEAAVCECPMTGGMTDLGQLDLVEAMAQMMLAFQWGGYSDAIRWGAVPAQLTVTPLGDVLFGPEFFDNVYGPFGHVSGSQQVESAVEDYPSLFAEKDRPERIGDLFDEGFDDAWLDEFGMSIDGILKVLDEVETEYVDHGPVITARRSALLGLMSRVAMRPPDDLAKVLTNFTLCPRPSWRSAGPGFVDRDWFPWRFRRRLSLLRRPFLQLCDDQDPDLTFAPGLLRDAIGLTIRLLHSGEVPDGQMRSKIMRSWLGSRNHRHRLAFNTAVANRMKELGWETKVEVKLTALTGVGLDRDYGDIDVVAWRPKASRLLLIECKDVQYHKTVGEVAEQLSKFRGESYPDGKPDSLKRHLDRIEVLRRHSDRVAKFLKLPDPLNIEGHIVFKNPVPMRFIADRLADRIRVSLFDELKEL